MFHFWLKRISIEALNKQNQHYATSMLTTEYNITEQTDRALVSW